MRPWSPEYDGRVDETEISSTALEGNPLGDASTRPVWVYLPPSYVTDSSRHYPTVYVLQGYMHALPSWTNRSAFRPTFLERVDALFSSGSAPDCIVVFVDAWTAYGGSQFVDSPAVGDYHTYLCRDIVSFVDERYRTLAAAAHRGVQGHSSGGFGAMISPMLRPDVFGALASHAGDALYEFTYLPEIAIAHRALRDRYDGSYDRFWQDFAGREPMSQRADASLVMVYGVAACFSPTEDGEVLLPFDPASGRLVDDVWRRWLDWDPVRMAPHYAEALRSRRGIYLDAGRSDEYGADLGAQAFAATCEELGATVTLELFDGGHSRIDHRYTRGLAFLAERLSPTS